ncbi:MAG: mechanosensitive ion channel family protein, partial [Ignavibacteria bacterium]|nr:mechanosensitive ion channel family protein [Ignavibacteria bacterium]
LSFVVRAFLRVLAKRIFTRTRTLLDDEILAVVLRHVRSVMVLIGLHVAAREVRKGVAETDLTALQVLDYAETILFILIVLVTTRVILGVVRVIVDWYIDRVSKGGSEHLKLTIGPLTSKVTALLLGLVSLIVILDHFDINIGSLLVSLGVGSLAIALAAQDTLANMIAGFVILVDRPFRVGDRIVLESGQTGDVQEIGLRSTKIMNFDANLIIIPNAELVKSKIVNQAYPFNQMRARIVLGVAYGTDPEKVRRILLRLADSHPDILKDPEPLVYLTALGDSAIEFTLLARASDFSKRFAAENALREQAYLAFGREGVEIPFPQRVVHMKTSA